MLVRVGKWQWYNLEVWSCQVLAVKCIVYTYSVYCTLYGEPCALYSLLYTAVNRNKFFKKNILNHYYYCNSSPPPHQDT